MIRVKGVKESMEYNTEQLKQAIQSYIEDRTYDYAIMINGLWGSGKSYFIKHEIVENQRFCKKSFIYVSLYGIKTIQELNKQIFIQDIFGNKEPELKYKLTNFACSVIYDKLEKKGIDLENLNTIKDIFEKIDKDSIIIFDDLERTSIPIGEILGFINGFVEHQHHKVIIVANEDEINREFENLELKYLVAMNDKITFESPDDIDKLLAQAMDIQEPDKKVKEINIKELKERVQNLFDEKNEYTKIKEKLVGITYNFVPNLEMTCLNILNKIKETDLEFFTYMQNKISSICETMESYNHVNLRTFQFFESKTCSLYQKLYSINYSNIEEIFDKYLIFILKKCIEIKTDKVSESNYDLVETHLLEYINGKKSLSEEFINSLMEKYQMLKVVNDTDKQVVDFLDWASLNEVKVKNAFDYIVENFDSINSNMYIELLTTCAYLENLKVLDRTRINLLIKSISKKMKSNSNIDANMMYMKATAQMVEKKEAYDIYKEYINELNPKSELIFQNPFSKWIAGDEDALSCCYNKKIMDINYFYDVNYIELYEKILNVTEARSIWTLIEIFKEIFLRNSFEWNDSINLKDSLSIIFKLKNKLSDGFTEDIDLVVLNAIDKLKLKLEEILERYPNMIEKENLSEK